MSMKPYVQGAISQMHSAVADVDAQFVSVRQDINSKKSHLNARHSVLVQERRMHLAEMSDLQDDAQRRMVRQRIAAIDKELADQQSQIAQMDAQLAQADQQKSGLQRSLNDAASMLNGLLSLPDIR